MGRVAFIAVFNRPQRVGCLCRYLNWVCTEIDVKQQVWNAESGVEDIHRVHDLIIVTIYVLFRFLMLVRREGD